MWFLFSGFRVISGLLNVVLRIFTIIVVAALFYILGAHHAFAAITRDTSVGQSFTASSPLTISYTNSGSAVIISCFTNSNAGIDVITSATWDGEAMSNKGFIYNSSGPQSINLWGVITSTTGTHDVVVNFIGGGLSCFVSSYVGVTAFDGTGSNGGSSPLSVSQTTLNGSWLVGIANDTN